MSKKKTSPAKPAKKPVAATAPVTAKPKRKPQRKSKPAHAPAADQRATLPGPYLFDPEAGSESDASQPADAATTTSQNGQAPAPDSAPPRLFPKLDELKTLYERYSQGAKFDDHDKAFYFVLDVGGLSRAKQLLTHVEEVLAELEELH